METGDRSKPARQVAEEWLARVLHDYPQETARFLESHQDPFRNPVGHALKDGLSVLAEELLDGMNAARIAKAMDSIVRIRAVQDFTPRQAVSFVFLAREVARRQLQDDKEALALVEARVDELALVAFDLFMRCREKIFEIKAQEQERSRYVELRRGG